MQMYSPYIGNAKYCFSNSASMLLASIGEKVDPELIEVLTGTGLGATFVKSSNKLFLNNQSLEPDLGIKSALKILGYEVASESRTDPDDFPIEELSEILTNSKAILGPLDMGYLTYQPDSKYLFGADHFVLALELVPNGLIVHDPAGYPYSFLPTIDLKNAWKAEGTASYKQGYYRYTASPKKVQDPSKEEIYERSITRFKDIYKNGISRASTDIFIRGKAALEHLAKLSKEGIGEKDLNHYVYFLFSLGAKRATDFSDFFTDNSNELAENKMYQAKLLGLCHSYIVCKDWKNLSAALYELAGLEEEFEEALINLD